MTAPQRLKKITNPKLYLSPIAWDWLSYKPSLTKRLREFTNNQIKFQVIREHWNLSHHNPIWTREITWQLHTACWIEATLLIPQSSINTETECLLSTNERPIGEQLFQEPSLTRSDFEFFQVTERPSQWIRESVFHFKQQPLTLREAFLPSFFKAIEPCD